MSKSLSERLRKEADVLDRIQNFDGRYEAEEAAADASKYREIADTLDVKDALLREAQEVLSVFADYPVSSIGMDLDGYVIKVAVGGQQPAFGDFDRARALLLKLTEATK